MNTETDFTIAPRLAADSLLLQRGPLSELRLVNDCRWPWLMLVPRVPGACELHDLSPDEIAALFAQVRTVSAALQSATACASINVAALGNVVAQLHVHVVARSPADPNWPGPVWGYGTPVPYPDAVPQDFATRVVQALAATERD